MNLPNSISLLRLLSVPILVWLILESFFNLAFWLFVLAMISDIVDGFIAKYFDLVTELGRYLDPIADKVLIISIYLILGYVGLLPSWLVIVVVTRDVLIVGGAMLTQVLYGGVLIKPLLLSKINTVIQMALAALIMGNLSLFHISSSIFNPIYQLLIWLTAISTLLSGIIYLLRWSMMESENQ